MAYLTHMTVSLCLFLTVHSQNSTEYDLHERLFKLYNPNIMPLRNKSEQQKVTMDMYLMSVDNINEKRQTITVKAFLECTWRDEFLTWDLNEYPHVFRINVKNTDIWIPDLALEDTFDKITDLGQEGGRADVKHTGKVTIWPFKMYTVSCKINIKKFPFDTQKCKFDFLSWTNPSSVFVLNSSQSRPDVTYFVESGEWELSHYETKHERNPYGNDSWDHVIVSLEMKRKPLFLFMNAMIPVFCISILNISCFILPADSGERITLSIAVFLTLAVFLTVVNDYMPESSDEIASFSVYVGLQLLGSAITILVIIISLNFFHKEKSKCIPLFLKTVARVCCTSERMQNNATNGTEIINGFGDSNFSDNVNNTVHMPVEDLYVTWRMVSKAVDRVCLISAIIWHTVLLLCLLISAGTS